MQIRQRILTALALGVAIIGLAALSARHTAPTRAQGEGPRARRGPHIRASLYGLHTLARGQTARLSAVSHGVEDQQPGDGSPPEPIRPRRVTLAFDIYEAQAADGSVHTLRFLRRESHTLLLRPGEAATLEFEASRAGETIAACVLTDPPDEGQPGETSPPEPVRHAVVTSLEVRQGNKTQFVLPAVRQGFDPQPEPPTQR